MVASGVAQRFDLFILTCLRNVSRRAIFGGIPLDEWSARRTDLYLATHNTHNRQTSMPRVGFKPTISTGERPKTYALDRAATGIGTTLIWTDIHASDGTRTRNPSRRAAVEARLRSRGHWDRHHTHIDWHPCFRRNSNPQSQQASSRRPALTGIGDDGDR
jgi:hypothetical protein